MEQIIRYLLRRTRRGGVAGACAAAEGRERVHHLLVPRTMWRRRGRPLLQRRGPSATEHAMLVRSTPGGPSLFISCIISPDDAGHWIRWPLVPLSADNDSRLPPRCLHSPAYSHSPGIRSVAIRPHIPWVQTVIEVERTQIVRGDGAHRCY